MSVPLPPDGTVGASYVHINDSVAGRSGICALWYSTRLSERISTYLNLSKDIEQRHSFGMWFGLSIDLGHQTDAYADVGRNNGRLQYGVGATRNADYDGGWEWQAQVNRGDGIESAIARGGYLGRYGEVIGSVQDTGGNRELSVEALGGLMFMDGVVEAARRIGDGFALISTDGTRGVPVLHENRLIGTTDDSSHLLVPDLNAYEHNSLAIDTLTLAADVSSPVDRLDVTPRGRSGVVAHFPIVRYQAAVMTVVDAAGKTLPAGTTLLHVESGKSFLVGYDGVAFIDGLSAQNHLQVNSPDLHCTAKFAFNPTAQKSGRFADVGAVVCHAGTGSAP